MRQERILTIRPTADLRTALALKFAACRTFRRVTIRFSQLRIVPEDLWLKVGERHDANRLGPQKTSSLASVRPRHLLGGKPTCGARGGPMIRSGGDQRFRRS